MSTKTAPQWAAVYARASVDKDDTKTSVERQADLGTGMAEIVMPGLAVRVYTDNDLSGTDRDRPALAALLADVAKGKVAGAVVSEQSRLTRRLDDLEPILDTFARAGARLWTLGGGEILTARGERVSARIHGVMAAEERDKTVARSLRAHDHARQTGKHVGLAPWGYRSMGDRGRRHLVVVPEEAETIRRMVSEVLGGSSLQAVADRLNRDGITTRRGKTWSGSQVRVVITNPTVAGFRAHRVVLSREVDDRGDERIKRSSHLWEIDAKGTWEPILTEAEWEGLQVVLDRREEVTVAHGEVRRIGRRGFTGRKHPLTGLLVCGKDSSRMRGSTKVRPGKPSPVIYRCPRCGLMVNAAQADAEVVAAALKALEGLAPHLAEVGSQDRGEVLRRDLAEAQARRRRVGLDYAAGVLDTETYADAVDVLTTTITRLETSLDALGDNGSEPTTDDTLAVLRAWEDAPLARQSAALQAVLSEIVVAPASGRAQPVAERLQPVWRV